MLNESLSVGSFFGVSLTVGAVAAVITEMIKQTQRIPWLSAFPPVQWLLNAVATGNIISVRVFLAVLCLGLSYLALYLTNGTVPTFTWDVSTLQYLMITAKAYFDATAGYTLVIK
jgi:hypothetical protein